MTWEEMERTMAFIVEQQAQTTVTVGRLSESVGAIAEKVDRTAGSITNLLAVAEIQAAEIRGLTESTQDLRDSTLHLYKSAQDLSEFTEAIADRQREADERGRQIDERLNVLINIVERHISEGRNGKG